MNKTKQTIDWQKIHERLAAGRDSLDRAFVLDERSKRDRLRQRSQQLARRGSRHHSEGPTLRVLVFVRDGQRLGVPLKYVEQVERLGAYTPVPRGVETLLGVANCDGEVHCVMDLRPLIGTSASDNAPEGYLVLMKWNELVLGVLADQIEEAATFRENDICAPENESAEYLRLSSGIGPQHTVLLDIEKLFAALLQVTCS
jgi:purine-binding chemotaxis protein CheW